MTSTEPENICGNTKNLKKPFNKKKWREQRYSGKAKVQKWENIKRQQTQKQFYRELKKEGLKINSSEVGIKPNKNPALSTFKKAQLQYNETQKIKEERKKEQERIQKEKNNAIKSYKEKKALRFRKLSQKTKKGQPLMRTRIELLLEKIQKEYGNNNESKINS